jgi:hypothetical protein
VSSRPHAARLAAVVSPVAVHVALDVPLYYYWACRIA